MSNLVLYSIPAFVVMVVLEILWARKHPEVRGYEKKDTAASLSMGVINVGISAGAKLLSIPFYAVLWEHRVIDIPATIGAWSWLVLFFAEDLSYYWFHRAHHEIRLLWAIHENHHSSTHYNFSTALRQPLLTPFTGPIFWAWLPLIGFPPFMVLTAQAWSLVFQFWLHTEAVAKLGPLEAFLNTPSHHRVHHGKNIPYLDRNHGGVLIVWDKLFGTFEPELEPVLYGTTKILDTYNPLRIGFHELGAIGRDVVRAPGLRAKLGYVFAPPGWSHDGSTQVASVLQAEWRRTGGPAHPDPDRPVG